MRRLIVTAAIAATAALPLLGTSPASAVCRPFLGPICLPACPLPDPDDPFPYACPL